MASKKLITIRHAVVKKNWFITSYTTFMLLLLPRVAYILFKISMLPYDSYCHTSLNTHTHTQINKKYNFPAPVSIKSTKYTFPKRSCWTKREKEKRNFTTQFKTLDEKNASGILPYLRNKSQLQIQKSKTSILSHFPSPLSDWKNKDTSEDLSRAMEERLLYLFAGQPIITSSRRGILSL